jgi:glycosyltransferase involved in cell wall biosynthesis
MKILKAADITRCVPGGVHSFMVKGGEALAEQGNAVDYMFKEDLASSAIPQRIRRFIVPWLLTWRVLRRQRRRGRYDVVEVHEPDAAAYCFVRRRLSFLALPPCTVISYGPLERRWQAQRERWRVLGERSLKSRLAVPLTLLPPSRYSFRNADHVLVSSEQDLRYIRNEVGVPSSRTGRADAGVGDEYFDIKRNASAKPYGNVVFIGTWIDRKGARELVEAWSILSGRIDSVRLTLLCTVTGEEEVLRHFSHSRDQIAVKPLMSQPELIKELADQHVFVLPAWFEGGTPLAALQAAAAGLACVVTSIGGNIDLIRPPDPEADGGVLIPPHDANALASAVERLVTDPPLIGRLGTNARNRARSFSWRKTAQQSLAAYDAAIDGSKSDAA